MHTIMTFQLAVDYFHIWTLEDYCRVEISNQNSKIPNVWFKKKLNKQIKFLHITIGGFHEVSCQKIKFTRRNTEHKKKS